MPSEESIFDEWVEVEDEKFRVLIYGFLRQEVGQFDILVRIINIDDQDISVLKFESTITNPIAVGVTVFIAVKLYGLCVAGSLIGSLGKAIYQEYNNSCDMRSGLPVSERAVDVYDRIKNKHSDLKGEAVKALAGCLPKAGG
jgi:hypothetical protein